MRGIGYLIVEVGVLLIASAAIGYLIGRVLHARPRRSRQSPGVADPAAETRARRLGALRRPVICAACCAGLTASMRPATISAPASSSARALCAWSSVRHRASDGVPTAALVAQMKRVAQEMGLARPYSQASQ